VHPPEVEPGAVAVGGRVEGGGEEVVDAGAGVVEAAEAVEGKDLVVEQPEVEFLGSVSLAVSDEGGQVEERAEGVGDVLAVRGGDAVDAGLGLGRNGPGRSPGPDTAPPGPAALRRG